MSNYNGGWALILIALAEVVVFAWIYGIAEITIILLILKAWQSQV